MKTERGAIKSKKGEKRRYTGMVRRKRRNRRDTQTHK